jgi:restriction system protein
MNSSVLPVNNESSEAVMNNGNEGKNYYLIRSCRNIPFEDGVVGVGWGDTEFCQHADAEAIIRHLIDDEGYDLDGRGANQIRRFKAIRKGDIIVVPFWGSVAIGAATGQELYDSKYYNEYGCNQHRVEYYRDSEGKACLIPRGNLSEALQKRLKIRITIANLNEFHSELDVLVANHQEGKTYSWTAEIKRKEEKLENEMKTQLLNHIRCGKTGLASGGIGLEQLVRELLMVDGYAAEILGKRAFPGDGDADIKASKTDMLRADDFLIQVKHHDGTTGLWGQQQLTEIKKLQPEEFKDCKLALVTSGDVLDEDKDYAMKHDITILDGNDLVEWIFTSVAKLHPDTKRRLGISEVPRIVE